MTDEKTAMHTLREERATSMSSQNSQEDPCIHDLEGDMTLNREATGCTVVIPRDHAEIHLGGCTPGESLPQSLGAALENVVGCTTASLEPHVTYTERPLGGCTPGVPLSLSTVTTPGGVVGCTATTPEPGQRRPVGCTTGTSPDHVGDSVLMGTVGCTTVAPLSLLEYTEDTMNMNLDSTTLTSPATSTPGTTPIRNKNGELMRSDL